METEKVGKWDVPKKLFDDYIKFRIHAECYLLDKSPDNSPIQSKKINKIKRIGKLREK